MPIRESERARYPENWKEISAAIRAREGNKCKFCGVTNHAWVWRDVLGQWHHAGKRSLVEAGFSNPPFHVACTFENGRTGIIKVIKIVLTVAHLNHTPEDCRPENLVALCQRCHLRYDREHHQKTRAQTRLMVKNQLELFSFTREVLAE